MDHASLLHLEDSPADAELIAESLRTKGFVGSISLVTDENEFKAMLISGDYDLVLLDYNVPGFNGLDAIHYIKQQKIDVPVIVVSGIIGEERATELIKSGAIDYVLKDNLSRLYQSSKRAIEEHQLRIKQKSQDLIYKELISSTHAGIIKINLSGSVTYANKQFIGLLGYDINHIYNHKLTGYFYGDSKKQLEHWQNFLKQKKNSPLSLN